MAWKILTMTDAGKGQWYRYSITGTNTEAVPPGPFSWSVPDVKDARYEAHPDASAEVKALVKRAKGGG